jgi:hypothetical protein
MSIKEVDRFEENNAEKTFKAKRREIQKNRKIIKQEYKEQVEKDKSEILKDITKEDRKTGAWFGKLLLKVLSVHAKKVNAKYFQEKYATGQKDVIAKKLITSYLRYNIAVGVVLGGAGGLGELIVAILSTFPEVALVTYNQLKLIYDLSVVYGEPVNMDDPEEAFLVLLIAFDIKLSEVFKGGAKWALDKGGKLFVEKAGKRIVLRKIQQIMLRTLGKKITQRYIKTIIAKTLPLIGAVFGAAVCGATDYFLTKRVANKTLYRYRTGKLVVDYFLAHDRIYDNIRRKGILHYFFRRREEADYVRYSQVLAKGCWIMVNADQKVDDNKIHLVDFIYSTKPLGEEFISTMKEKIKIPLEEFMNDFELIKCRNKNNELEIKKTIFYAMKLIAVSDNKISEAEVAILEKIVPYVDTTPERLRAELEELKNNLFIL